MYSDDSPLTLPIGSTLAAMNLFKTQVLPRQVSSYLPSPPARPLNVQTVASFIIDVVVKSLDEKKGDNGISEGTSSLRIYDTRQMLSSA